MKKAAAKKRGRPPSDDARRKAIQVRVSADEYALLEKAAADASAAASQSTGFPINIEVATYMRDFIINKIKENS